MTLARNVFRVAPHAGAWIETCTLAHKRLPGRSLPTRERGLKPPRVAPRLPHQQSLPTRERGLKLTELDIAAEHIESLPTRERGLKPRPLEALDEQGWSLPTRERGLKLDAVENQDGATSRSPRGSVD